LIKINAPLSANLAVFGKSEYLIHLCMILIFIFLRFFRANETRLACFTLFGYQDSDESLNKPKEK